MAGKRLAEARALLPDLAVRQRAVEREQAALKRLACWAGSFTSEVCCLAQSMLLLEVAASLRLFGGAAKLFEGVVAGCAAQGHLPQAALAPTPLAAQWLAIGGDDRTCCALDELPQRLGGLPLSVLALAPGDEARLASFGARSLADLLRLPRAGLARRLGTGLVADLARALGDLPDPRQRFVFPELFAERLELPLQAEQASALGWAARRLIDALCGWLAARGGGVSECVFEFRHESGARQRPATVLALGFAGATRDAERMSHVLGERLQRLHLPAAVECIGLRAGAPAALVGHSRSLFVERGEGAGDESMAGLLERLQARLGDDGVHALSAVAEHRPENAWRRVAAAPLTGEKSPPGPFLAPDPRNSSGGPRPLCLLAQPQALRELAGRPQCGGPLRLLAGPERIESGWWDAAEPDALGDVCRDYFVAISRRDEWLWIFRSQAGWFLHGVFS